VRIELLMNKRRFSKQRKENVGRQSVLIIAVGYNRTDVFLFPLYFES